jgi:hypothetical protein
MAKDRQQDKNKGAQNESETVSQLPTGAIDLESFIRAALLTGKMPATDSRAPQKKKAAKRRPRKGGK